MLGASLRLLGFGVLVCGFITAVVNAAMDLSADTTMALWFAFATLVTNGASRVFGHPILALDASARDLPVMLCSRLLLVSGVLWAAWSGTLAGVLLAYLVAGAILATGRAWVVHRHLFALRPDFDRDAFRELFARSRHVGVAEIGAEVTARIDVPMLEAMATTYAVGLYGACYRVIAGIYAGNAAVGRALFPGLVAGLADGRMNTPRRLYTWFPVLVALGTTGAAFTLDEFTVHLLYGDAYLSAAPVLRVLLLAAGAAGIAYFLSNYALAVGRERVLPAMHLTAAVLNVSLNLYLIPAYGAWGAAVATLACESLKALWLVVALVPKVLRAPR